jgi:hypothetical protein
VHAVLDMTLPGLISEQSVAQDGAWLAVPVMRDGGQRGYEQAKRRFSL